MGRHAITTESTSSGIRVEQFGLADMQSIGRVGEFVVGKWLSPQMTAPNFFSSTMLAASKTFADRSMEAIHDDSKSVSPVPSYASGYYFRSHLPIHRESLGITT